MKLITNWIITFAFFSGFFFSMPCNRLYAQDKVIAIVNKEVITQKDLNDFMHFMRMQYSKELEGKALEEKLKGMRSDLLNRLIEERIILQKAKEEKIDINQERVKERIDEIKKHYPSEADFEQDLAKQGLVQADLENKIREQIMTYYLIEQKVRSKITVRPEEITSFYQEDKRRFIKAEERLLTVIILDDENMAKTISYQLRLGVKLEELAAKYPFSTDILSASKGQELRQEIEDTVFKLGIGEVSEPVEIDQQFYVFKLDDIIGSQQMSLSQAKDNIREFLVEKKTQKALAEWLDELKKQSYIKIFEN
ncbi:MAG: SurA N-terminal domain-containing protein [Candidatus Omnitrophica bacterium]|nr:SurA N-terminal domain-containing protein [Candidatus Omnitrophota bacterium]